MQKMRLETIREILKTEITYVHQLQTLVNLFYKPMKEKKILSNDRLSILFGNSK